MPGELLFYTVYFDPKDEPGKYVVRAWTVTEGQVMGSEEKKVADTLEEIRAFIPQEKVRTRRVPGDDPCIVETWI